MSSHIFVVDDDPAIGRLARIVLQTEGFEVAAFTSPLEAMQEVVDPSSPNPLAIVLDLNMPEMSGQEFYTQARWAGFDGPIVILSAYGADFARKELGADASISKPFQPSALAITVSNLLHQRRS